MAIPPRSPDLNPIENIFYLIKMMLQYGKPIVAIFNTEIQFQFNKIQFQFNEIQVQFNFNSISIQ